MDEIKWGDQRLPLRFWEKTKIDMTAGCWAWTAGTDSDGYAYFRFPAPVTTRRAARGAYIVLVGPITDGMTIQHDCHVAGCVNVNPGHAGRTLTSPDNVRNGKARIQECPQGHPYTPENTIMVGPSKNRRGCRTCYNDRSREYWHTTRKAAEKAARRAAGYRGGVAETSTCLNGHERNEKNTRIRPDGYEACRPCGRAANARFEAKKTGKRTY